MMVVKRGFGATRGTRQVRRDPDGATRSISPGEALGQYPWERGMQDEVELQRLRGDVYPAPIRYGATPVGRPGPMEDEFLVALARHGTDPFETAQASVRDLVSWYHTGNSDTAAQDEVSARRSVIRNLAQSRSIDSSMQSYVDGAADLAFDIVGARGRVR
jgi:hypothetical protein